MKTIIVSETTGPALDWLVATAKGISPKHIYISGRGKNASIFRRNVDEETGRLTGTYTTGPELLFSKKWEAGGPIIDREKVCLKHGKHIDTWAYIYEGDGYAAYVSGPTPLIAAMRCYVVSKLGETVEVPEELI